MADYPVLKLLINGEWISRPGQPVINPADETTIGTVPHATTADLAAAVAAAEQGFKVWRNTSPAKRAEIILKAVGIMRQRVEEMAVVMTLEQGKPIAQSRLEVQRASDIIEWDAQEGRRTYGRIIPSEPGMRHTVLRQPIGPVAAFSPWNFPVSSPSRKIGGALSAGCSIILKASEETPGGAYQLARCLRRCRIAAGRAQPGVRRSGRDLGIPDPAPEHPARDLHRLDPGRQAPRRHGRPAHEARHHGARRSRAGHRVRRRRPGSRRSRCRARQVAQRRPGMRVADPLVRRRAHLRAVRQGLCREGGRPQDRQRPRSLQPDGSARQPSPHRGHDGAGRRRQGEGRQSAVGRRAARQPRLLLPADGPIGPAGRGAGHARGAVRAAGAGQSGARTSTRRSARPTHCPTASRPMPSPTRRATSSGCRRNSRSATCRSTTTSPRSPRRRSAASRTAATAARAASRACRATRS